MFGLCDCARSKWKGIMNKRIRERDRDKDSEREREGERG
jgi:hypothetical protein